MPVRRACQSLESLGATAPQPVRRAAVSVPPRTSGVSLLAVVAVGVPAVLLIAAAHLAAEMRPFPVFARAVYTLWAAVILTTVGVSAYLLRGGRGVSDPWRVLWTAGFVAFALQ